MHSSSNEMAFEKVSYFAPLMSEKQAVEISENYNDTSPVRK